MLNVFNLVLPFFGLIFLGFFVARINRQPLEALGWMNIFIIYVALPALFFQIFSKTPVAELTQWAFIIGCTASTFCIFLVMFLTVFVRTRKIDESTIQGLAAFGEADVFHRTKVRTGATLNFFHTRVKSTDELFGRRRVLAASDFLFI